MTWQNRSRFIIPLEVDFDYLLKWLGPVKDEIVLREKISSTLPREDFLEWMQRDFQGVKYVPSKSRKRPFQKIVCPGSLDYPSY